MKHTFARALDAGAERLSLVRCRWIISGNCEQPVETLLYSQFHRDLIRHWYTSEAYGEPIVVFDRAENGRYNTHKRDHKMPLQIDLHTRCRKCDNCTRYRAALWRARANAETQVATRTWFGTLTLRPEEHFRAWMRAAAKVHPVDIATLPYGEQFVLRHNAISPDLTKFVKRVRKNSGAQLRYLMVAEAHKSGLPHYHMLIHESGQTTPIRHRVLKDAWDLGYTDFKLVSDPKQATYLCKYLSKAAKARVRASQRYGVIPSPMIGDNHPRETIDLRKTTSVF